ncbi:MAG TPA: trypsin [Campylobacterales bacterium]|nr:trypsin [Campylobacterales bacterium]
MLANNLRIILPLGFFIFISFIIFLADTADHNFAFRLLGQVPYGDKIGHVVLYGVMALLLNYGLKFKFYRFLGFNMQLGALIVFAFAIIEEGTQYYIPSRSFDLYDVLGDFIGVVLFSLWRR